MDCLVLGICFRCRNKLGENCMIVPPFGIPLCKLCFDELIAALRGALDAPWMTDDELILEYIDVDDIEQE